MWVCSRDGNWNYKWYWTLQPTTSLRAEIGLREACASKHPHPGNFWLSVSPFCKPTPSFPALCHPHPGADSSLPLPFSRHGPHGDTPRVPLWRGQRVPLRGTGHCSILGMCSSAPTQTPARGLQRAQGGCRTCSLPLWRDPVKAHSSCKPHLHLPTQT